MYKIEQQGQHVKLLGQLDFTTVAELLKTSPIDMSGDEICVDLSEINRFNSAALALLIEWMKKAQQKGLQIKYHNAPEQLMAIARAYGIEQELPLITPSA